jgi:hypothetical protein
MISNQIFRDLDERGDFSSIERDLGEAVSSTRTTSGNSGCCAQSNPNHSFHAVPPVWCLVKALERVPSIRDSANEKDVAVATRLPP